MPTKLFLPNLFEFIYHTLTEKGSNFLFNRLIDREDWVKVRTESKIRIFAETANMEDKIILLSKIGIGCALVFWDKEKEKTKKVEDVVIGYIDTPENDLTKLIVKDKIFACRDIDFIKSLQLIAKSSLSTFYSISKRYLHIRENSKVLKTRKLVDYLEAEKNLEWYSQTIQFALDLEPVLEQFKLNMYQFRILLALHTAPNGVFKDTLQKKLERVNISGMLNDMHDNNLISFSATNKNVVIIDVYGIIILEQIFAKFP